jgi:hypothetical protein
MQRPIIGLGIIGAILFGAALMLSFASPRLVESAMREVIRIQVERESGRKVDALLDTRIAGMAQRALGGTDEQIQRARERLRAELPAKVATVVADMARPDCECRVRLADAVQVFERQRLQSLLPLRERLVALIESAYSTVANSLLREFRIFTASNALAFAALGLIAAARPGTGMQLALPAAVMSAAVIVTGGLYLFGQNWLHTIVFNDYVGLSYLGYLFGTALLFGDVLLNRARVTTRVVNRLLHSVGSTASAIAC